MALAQTTICSLISCIISYHMLQPHSFLGSCIMHPDISMTLHIQSLHNTFSSPCISKKTPLNYVSKTDLISASFEISFLNQPLICVPNCLNYNSEIALHIALYYGCFFYSPLDCGFVDNGIMLFYFVFLMPSKIFYTLGT